MNIQYLKYAVEVAKAGSLSKASETLCVAQPNLSRAVKELENELGITLFERCATGMSLTPDGARLVSYAKKLLREMEEIEHMFKSEDKKKAHFSISVPRASYISKAFVEFSKCLDAEERCEVFYQETNAMNVIKNITDSDYKLGIVRYAEQYDKYFKEMFEQKGLAYELVTEFKYRLAMSNDCPLAELDVIEYTDLADFIEIAHADPYVPTLGLADVRKMELPESGLKRIFVFERGGQFDLLSSNPETYMWVSPIPQDTLERFGITERDCPDNTKTYKDMLVYRKDYKLTNLDKNFITALCRAKREVIG